MSPDTTTTDQAPADHASTDEAPTDEAPTDRGRNWPLILVATFLVLAIVGAVLAGISASGGGFNAVAYTVNGTTVSQRTVNSQLSTLADHDAAARTLLADPFQISTSAVSGDAASAWLTVQIFREIGHQTLAAQGKKITDADRSKAAAATLGQAGATALSAYRALPASIRFDVADLLALQNVVKASALRKAHISVDPKYGFWSAKNGRVCPPTGCPSSTAASGASGG